MQIVVFMGGVMARAAVEVKRAQGATFRAGIVIAILVAQSLSSRHRRSGEKET